MSDKRKSWVRAIYRDKGRTAHRTWDRTYDVLWMNGTEGQSKPWVFIHSLSPYQIPAIGTVY